MTKADFELVDPSVLHGVVGGFSLSGSDPEAELSAACGAGKKGARDYEASKLLDRLTGVDRLTGGGRAAGASHDLSALTAGLDGIKSTTDAREADCLAKGRGYIANPPVLKMINSL